MNIGTLTERRPEIAEILKDAQKRRRAPRKAKDYELLKQRVSGWEPGEYEAAIKLICAEMEM